jgi:hypothetical protein
MHRARWYPRENARIDLDRARQLADDIAVRQNSSSRGLGLFAVQLARIVNWQL